MLLRQPCTLMEEEEEVGNAGRVVNTGTSSVNSEFVTALIYVIFYLFLVNIIGNCHENKYIWIYCDA